MRLAADEAAAIYREKTRARARIYYRRVCSSLLQQQLPAMLCRRSRTVMSVASRAGTVTTAPTMNNLLTTTTTGRNNIPYYYSAVRCIYGAADREL